MIPSDAELEAARESASSDFLSSAELARLAVAVSAGDVMAAQREAGGDPTRMTELVVGRTAKRLGLADPDAILDRLSTEQVTWLARRMSGAEDPTLASSTGSPPSVAIGE